MKMNKEKVIAEAKNIFFVILGSLCLAMADAFFTVPCNLINGGVDSIGILINHYIEPLVGFNVTDIIMGSVNVILWLVSLLVLGKKVSFHTLLGTLVFPLFYTLLLRTNAIEWLGISNIYANNMTPDGRFHIGVLMVAGIFGGALAGMGVAFAFLGDGSTGGLDVISAIIAKYTDVKEDVSGFIIDSSLIVIGIFIFRDWGSGLCGVISAFTAALAIQYIYIHGSSYIIAEVITNKPEEILQFIHKQLGHGSTVVNITGGFSKEQKKLIRVVLYKKEVAEFRTVIGSVDKSAFVTFLQAKAINGDGFDPFTITMKERRRVIRKYSLDVNKKKDIKYVNKTIQRKENKAKLEIDTSKKDDNK